MDKLGTGLGPAFAAGFAVQRLLEVFDGVINLFPATVVAKKTVTAVISVLIGLGLAMFGGLRVLGPLGLGETQGLETVVDVIVTVLVLSAGTEGSNSILKFLGYAKEDKKAQAVESLKTAVPRERTDALLSGLNPPQHSSVMAAPAAPEDVAR